MNRNIYARIEPLKNLMGRIDYITSPDRQENLYAVYRTDDDFPWRQLASECRDSFRKSGTEGSCIEGREMILALPEEFQEYVPQELLAELTEQFKERYGVECISALHHNRKKTNYHIHLIFSERRLLEEPEIKVASRNMFYDESGRHVRTKKEILDEDGTIRRGCKVIRKGEVYSRKLFGKKDPHFKSRTFVGEVKNDYMEIINTKVKDEKNRLDVYDGSDIYLPTKKIGKYNPREMEIVANNKAVAEWNYYAYKAAECIPREMVKDIKHSEIIDRISAARNNDEEIKGHFRKIVKEATSILIRFVRRWDRMLDNDRPKPKSEGFFKMLEQARKLVRKDRERER